MSGDDAVILMCKAPIPGTVKTRLCPPLSPRRAAEFYSCMLEDAAATVASLPGTRKFLFYAPLRERRRFLVPPFGGLSPEPQKGKDLGERMAHAMGKAFGGGARRAVVVGADCPALSKERIRSAYGELRSGADAVFGPAEDGGFYLVGLSSPAPGLFRGIAWSTPGVLAEVLSRCRAQGLTYSLLPAESDIDTADDLAALRRWTRLRVRSSCRRTRDWLSRASGLPTWSPSSFPSGGRASSPIPGRRPRSAG